MVLVTAFIRWSQHHQVFSITRGSGDRRGQQLQLPGECLAFWWKLRIVASSSSINSSRAFIQAQTVWHWHTLLSWGLSWWPSRCCPCFRILSQVDIESGRYESLYPENCCYRSYTHYNLRVTASSSSITSSRASIQAQAVLHIYPGDLWSSRCGPCLEILLQVDIKSGETKQPYLESRFY